MTTTDTRIDALGRVICARCAALAHADECDPRNVQRELVRQIIARGMASRCNAATIADIVLDALNV